MIEKEHLTSDLTEEEKFSLECLNYPTKPIIFSAHEAIESEQIRREGDNIIIRIEEKEIEIGPDHQYSLVEPTMFGLNEALVRAEGGTTLREEFEKELEVMGEMDEDLIDYGSWVYYPRDNKLFHFASENWHRLALSLTNSRLLMDPDRNLSFAEVNKKFSDSVVAVIGLSVGNNIAHGIIKDIRPKSIIVADPALYKMTNANRVITLRASDMVLSESEKKQKISLWGLRPKWQVFAEQTHAMDPFMNIYCYPEAGEANMSQLIGGNRAQPKADIVIDVCDTTSVKLAAAEEARRRGVPFIRFTDAGSTVRMDLRRFDLDKNLPITYGVEDDELYRLSSLSENSRDDFFRFADALIGSHLDRNDEFGMLVKGKIPRISTSVPQLGSTAIITGGMAGEIVGRILLGHKFPERVIFDFHNLSLETYGDVI